MGLRPWEREEELLGKHARSEEAYSHGERREGEPKGGGEETGGIEEVVNVEGKKVTGRKGRVHEATRLRYFFHYFGHQDDLLVLMTFIDGFAKVCS